MGFKNIVVEFPLDQRTLTFAPTVDALEQLQIEAGTPALLDLDGQLVTIEKVMADGLCQLQDGRTVSSDRLWPIPSADSPMDQLSRGQVASLADFNIRLAALRLRRVREADGLGSFLGGRIRLYPHQLYAAEGACRQNPVRWLLADGVGLGKTVEACLIMNHLIHTGRSERTLVVVPEALTVQWLGELWRKHHQVFVLLDDDRISDARREQGDDCNPFETTPLAIIALETLISEPWLVERALVARIDLVVVDEAHHLQRPEGRPGNLAYRAIAPLAAQGSHLLLLTATPLEDDAHGFLRLIQLLQPDQLPEDEALLDRLEPRHPLPPCTTATRAEDIDGWPPRVPAPVEMTSEQWQPMADLEIAMRQQPAEHEVARARKAQMVSRALASAPALAAVLKRPDEATQSLLRELDSGADPRLEWLIEQAPLWRRAGNKTLIFVAHIETLDLIKTALERCAHIRAGLFHEELSVKRRDIEVAQLRLPEGPSLLITTECGGEGRNFEMCDRLVLFDLPWSPSVVEQRIGRLDRIGRKKPTEIVYFRPPDGLAGALVRLYEDLGIFSASVGGIDRELKIVAQEIASIAAGPMTELKPGHLDEVLASAKEARSRVAEAAYHELHRDPFRSDMAPAILERVPPRLEPLTASVVLAAAAAFGFEVEQQGGNDTWLIGLGGDSLVDRLPGVPPDSRFLGTFDREEAVTRETIDFFSAGHPLVEGVLNELADGSRGRTACFEVAGSEECLALLAIYEQQRMLTVVDGAGRRRTDLEELLLEEGAVLHSADHQQWTAMPGWSAAVRRMAEQLPAGEPSALAIIRVNPNR